MVWGKTFSGETLPRKVPAGQDAARVVSVRSGRPGPHARGASLRPRACDSTTTETRATAPGWSLLGVPACDSSVRSGRHGPHVRGGSLRPPACDSTTTEARPTAPGWSLLGVPACDSTATVATTTRRSACLTASVATATRRSACLTASVATA